MAVRLSLSGNTGLPISEAVRRGNSEQDQDRAGSEAVITFVIYARTGTCPSHRAIIP
jgi:hypothetical protein